MSINDWLLEREADGALKAHKARSARLSRRCLYKTEELQNKLDDPNNWLNILSLRGELESAFARWTLGERIYDDGRGKAGFLKRLTKPPPEIWEIRITNPSPQVRVFGRFIAPNTFVATHFYSRNYLGKKSSPAWYSAQTECEKAWIDLGAPPPFTGSVIVDYVTESCDVVPI